MVGGHHLRAAVAIAWMTALAPPASAQTGRIGGVVRDQHGQPIKTATVVADNPNASPASLTATTDEKGRFSIVGLRGGDWKLTASAPGFAESAGTVSVRTVGAPNPPIQFTLARRDAPPELALAGVNTKELQADLTAAETMYTSGQYDQAIAAYKAIAARVPALTSIHIAMARAYRMKKDYGNALAEYEEVLKTEPDNGTARLEIGLTGLEKGDLTAAESALSQAAARPGAGKEVFYYLGEVQFARAEVEQAAASFRRAADLDQTWAKPMLKLALIELNRGNTAECVTLLEKVQTIEPSSDEAAQARTLIAQLKK